MAPPPSEDISRWIIVGSVLVFVVLFLVIWWFVHYHWQGWQKQKKKTSTHGVRLNLYNIDDKHKDQDDEDKNTFKYQDEIKLQDMERLNKQIELEQQQQQQQQMEQMEQMEQEKQASYFDIDIAHIPDESEIDQNIDQNNNVNNNVNNNAATNNKLATDGEFTWDNSLHDINAESTLTPGMIL